MNVFISVTHLLGSGHLVRALTLAHAFRAAGHRVRVASGGTPVPHLALDGIDLVQLPPVRSDGVDFSRLLNEAGLLMADRELGQRADMLRDAMTDMAPDILITELFPFGRRSLTDEYLTLLDAAYEVRPRPILLSSVRDILAPPSRPEKAARTEELVKRYYDAVLVHTDPQVTPLEASWPVSADLAARLQYTGFVAPAPAGPHPEAAGAGEVLVSAGGGAVGGPVFRAAVAAARLMPGVRWRLLVGGGDPSAEIAELRDLAAGTDTVVEPARPDFRSMLTHAAASISLCGYNTALDILQTGTPAVFVPFDAGNEVEQGLRAASLARLPAMKVVESGALSPEALAEAVAAVMAQGPRAPSRFGFAGAHRSVEIACALAGEGV